MILCRISTDEKTGEKNIEEYPMLKKFDCGKIPVMLKSKFCILSQQNGLTQTEMGEGYYDPGGYFIVRGSEKVIICQERKLENKVHCFALMNLAVFLLHLQVEC